MPGTAVAVRGGGHGEVFAVVDAEMLVVTEGHALIWATLGARDAFTVSSPSARHRSPTRRTV